LDLSSERSIALAAKKSRPAWAIGTRFAVGVGGQIEQLEKMVDTVVPAMRERLLVSVERAGRGLRPAAR
jgi:hypothetical protein